MKKLVRITVVLLFIFVFSGCNTVGMLVQKPEVTVSSVEIRSISFQNITLDMNLQLYNPNPIAVDLESFDYDFLIEETVFLRGNSSEGLNLAANGSSVITIPLTVDYKELYQAVSAMKGQDESAYRVDTGFNFLLPVLGEQRIELSHEGTIPNVRLPRFKFRNLYVKSLGLMGADLVILMDVANPNAFDIDLNGFAGILEINKQKWAELGITDPVDFTSGETGELGFQFRLEFLSMGRTVRDLLANQQNLNYDFSGDILLDSSLQLMEEMSLPLHFSGEVELLHPDTSGGEHSSRKIEDSIELNLINIFGVY